MTHDTILRVPMDSKLKEQAEQLYFQLGTSFEEAVRVFAAQSVLENRMPFEMHIPANTADVSRRIGIAKGKFKTPINIDAGDNEIEKLFGVE